MSCDFEALESLAFGELALDRARPLRDHANSCPDCARELRQLLEDRALFHRRAAALPALPRVELFPKLNDRAAQVGRRYQLRRQVTAFALCAASLLVVFSWSSPSKRSSPIQLTEAECAASSFQGCVDDVGDLEAEFAACLVATPLGTCKQ